jgi:hypothetical protein
VPVAATPFQDVSGFRSAGIRIMMPSAIAVSAVSRCSDAAQDEGPCAVTDQDL